MMSLCVEQVTCASRGPESPRERRVFVGLLRVQGIAGDHEDSVVSIPGCVSDTGDTCRVGSGTVAHSVRDS